MKLCVTSVWLREPQRRLGRRQLRLGLADLRVEDGRVQCQQHLALGHVVVKVRLQLVHRARHLRADIDQGNRINGAGSRHRLRDIARIDGRGAETWRFHHRGLAFGIVRARTADYHQQTDCQRELLFGQESHCFQCVP
jgi:hypothetical protein